MAEFKITTPDGGQYKITAPDNASEADVMKYASLNINAQQSSMANLPQSDIQSQQPSSPIGAKTAALASGIEAIPFGADIAASFDALQNPMPGKSFGENQAAAKTRLMQAVQQGRQENPGASMAGSVVGALATVPLIPAKALQGASIAERAIRGAGVGAALGGLHGFGTGNTADQRITGAVEEGALGGLFGGIASPVADAVGAAARPTIAATRNLAGRVSRLFGNNVSQQIAAVPAERLARVSGMAQQAPQAADTLPITLTKGQATQDPRLQALESGAVAGNYGDDAQRMANQAREIQSEQAKTAISSLAGQPLTTETPAIATNDLVNNLRTAYSDIRKTVSENYKAIPKDTQIAADYVRQGIIPSLKDWAKEFGTVSLNAPELSNARRLYNMANDFAKNDNITAANLYSMEQWRGAVSKGIRDTKTPSEKAFLSGMLQRYDTAMDVLPREAVKNGDEETLKLLEFARSSRKEQGMRFERSKLVRDIVQNEDLTNEQFANSILSLGNKSGAYVRDIFRAAGNNAAMKQELQAQTKQALLGSILNKSLSAEVKAGGTIQGGVESLVSFDKLTTNLGKLLNNKTLFNQVFQSENDRQAMRQLYNAASLIKSQKPGTKNYSNTAYTLLNAMQRMSPSLTSANILGIGAGSAVKSMAQAGAENELAQSIAPVLRQIAADSENVITNFGSKYGRSVMAAETQPFGREANKPIGVGNDVPEITIRPMEQQ